MSEYETCLREGCDSIVKTQGLCSAHYMARWRAEQKILEEEFSRIDGEFGGIKDYICDGEDGTCEGTPVRWFAPKGAVEEVQALCPIHVTLTLESLRMDIRRLEWK